MSFTRVNVAGWAVGDQLTSAQQNQLDIDHSNALDKTVAGDTLSGIVQFSGAGQIKANLANAIQATVLGGIKPTVAGGIQSSIAQGLEGTVQDAIAATVAGGISSDAVGGIQLNGGTTDWIAYAQARTHVMPCPGHEVSGVAAAGSAGNEGANYTSTSGNQPQIFDGAFITVAVNSGSASQIPYYLPLRNLHNGATLATALLYLKPNVGHAALPQLMPAFGIFRTDITSGVPFGAGTVALLSTGGGVVVDPTTPVGNYNGTLHTVLYTANQNNVIDTTKYLYHITIWDEGGTNSISGCSYFGLQVTFNNITSTAF